MNESSDQVHKIIIFEDCSVDLNLSNQANIKNFLFQSRHRNFSIILITHNTNHAYAKKDSFERCFLQNASAYAFTLGHFSDTRLIQNFMRDCLDFKVLYFKFCIHKYTRLYFLQRLQYCSCRVTLVMGAKLEPNFEVVLPSTFCTITLTHFDMRTV